jgi:hypothetical protein
MGGFGTRALLWAGSVAVAQLAATMRQEAGRDPHGTRSKEVAGVLAWVTRR